jgi:hypothetical protein
LLVKPTHFTGEPGYLSDTESSKVIPDVLWKTDPSAQQDLHHELADINPSKSAAERHIEL